MYKVRANVMVNDFSSETKEFLLKIGFKDNDNMSEIFQNMLYKKGYSLNDIYTSKITLCNVDEISKKINFINDYEGTIYCHSAKKNSLKTIAKEKMNEIRNYKLENTYKLSEVRAS